jgi:hypothetical protein
MDRKAVFTPAFQEFLTSQQIVEHQERTQSRYRQEDGTFKMHATEWRDILRPSYRQEILPQTLTVADVQHDRWPVACYRFHLKDGTILETFAQHTREFLGNDMTVDFMGLQRVVEGKEPEIMDQFCWSISEVNEYLPGVMGNRRGSNMEVMEPNPV